MDFRKSMPKARRIKRGLSGKMLKESQDIMRVEDPRDSDIVIPVMGLTGSGKSSFINRIVGENVLAVGSRSSTSSIQHTIIRHPTDEGRRIILVDMPGFDDIYTPDVEILKQISLWLARSYHDGLRVAGIIYLHEILQPRVSETVHQNFEMFRKLCGDEALRNVVLGTTKWDEVNFEVGQQREQVLKDIHWKEMLQRGSVIMRVLADSASAWEIINHILKNDRIEFVRIQEELLEFGRHIPETDAGRTLLYTLDHLQARLSAEERTARRMRGNMDEIRMLKVPLSEKVKRFFGLRK